MLKNFLKIYDSKGNLIVETEVDSIKIDMVNQKLTYKIEKHIFKQEIMVNNFTATIPIEGCIIEII